MEKEEIKKILFVLSEGYLKNNIQGNLYANVVESLIVINDNLTEDFEEFADFLAQFHEPTDDNNLYGANDLREKIVNLFPELKDP